MLDLIPQLTLFAMIVVPIAGFRRLRRAVLQNRLSKIGAMSRFAGLCVLPILVFLAVLAIEVGLEEIFGWAIVAEGVARSVLLVLGIGFVLWALAVPIFILSIAGLRGNE